MLKDFWDWLVVEARQPLIEPAVQAGYEHAFMQELRRLIGRTRDPGLRAKLEDMLDCPVRTSTGSCVSFTDYVIGALLRHGVHRRYDMEAALGYVFEMMMDRTDTGGRRTTLFSGFDEDRLDAREGNPLQARFLTFVSYAVRNVARGKIPRLSTAERRPAGTVSIGQGRRRPGDEAGGVSPDEIAARPDGDLDVAEMIEDIEGLLRKKERASGIPLVDLFRATVAGMAVHQQRVAFGDRHARLGREVIIRTIEDYARSSGNATLLHLLARLRSDQQGEGATPKKPAKTPRPVLSEKERDYASIVNVIARFDRPVGSSDLGRLRARWLEYPPREPASGHRNRLEEVLAKMVEDAVLKATRTSRGALSYSPGPRFDQYRPGGAV